MLSCDNISSEEVMIQTTVNEMYDDDGGNEKSTSMFSSACSVWRCSYAAILQYYYYQIIFENPIASENIIYFDRIRSS